MSRIPCPHCKKGNFLPGRSLSLHWNVCEASSTVLDTLAFPELNNKRMNVNKHESTKTLKRRKKSMEKHINKHHSECHSVKVSHLSIMPLLGNLIQSSMFKDHTQFIAAEPDVDFDDICDTQQDEHAIDFQNKHYPMANLPLPRSDESQYVGK